MRRMMDLDGSHEIGRTLYHPIGNVDGNRSYEMEEKDWMSEVWMTSALRASGSSAPPGLRPFWRSYLLSGRSVIDWYFLSPDDRSSSLT